MRSLSVTEPPAVPVPNEINPVVPRTSLLLITKPPVLYFTISADVEALPSLFFVSSLKIEPALPPVLKFDISRYLRVLPASVTTPNCKSPPELMRNLSSNVPLVVLVLIVKAPSVFEDSLTPLIKTTF